MKRHITSFLIIAQCILLIATLQACTVHDGPPLRPLNPSEIQTAHPHREKLSRYGNPVSYVVKGHRYYVSRSAVGYNKFGIASWYGRKFEGHLTSTRETYNPYAMTGASTTLPLPTYVRVTNLENGRHVIVRINDRGPFDKNRLIDLSYAAAIRLGYEKKGTAYVEVTSLNLGR